VEGLGSYPAKELGSNPARVCTPEVFKGENSNADSKCIMSNLKIFSV
jgi:hypothetical protein